MRVRSWSDVRAAGDGSWFEPALSRLRALAGEPDPALRDCFDPGLPILIARAPARLDVMGGIADYSGGLVLQLPLAESTWVMLQRQDILRCDVVSRRGGRWHAFDIEVAQLATGAVRTPELLARWFAEHPDRHWAAYVIGVIQHCLSRSPGPGAAAGGFRLLIDSTVPEGRGISSSAALEVATMGAVMASFGDEQPPEALAAACQWVENNVVGAPCGIMDQMTSACGRRDRLLRLRCQPATIEGFLEVPPGYRFYGIDSGIRHAVTGADYTTVRTAAFMGYRMIAKAAGFGAVNEAGRWRVTDPRWNGYLTNLRPAEFSLQFEAGLPERMSGRDFLDECGGIPDPVTRVEPDRIYPVRAATAHPVMEQERVARFAALLGDLPSRPRTAVELGRLMYGSHRSYGACGLGSGGTDRLVALVAEASAERGLFGAKITGGGSGGTVAVLGTVEAEPLVRALADRYRAESGRDASVFAESGPGAEQTGVLRVAAGEL